MKDNKGQSDKIEYKLDKLSDKVETLTIELKTGFERYNQLLDRHIEGVEQNRTNVVNLNKKIEQHEKHIVQKLEPIKKHVTGVQAVIKVGAWVLGGGLVGALLVAAVKYLI